jgi:hypothetical protein
LVQVVNCELSYNVTVVQISGELVWFH